MNVFAQSNEKELFSRPNPSDLKSDLIYALRNVACEHCSAVCDAMKINGNVKTTYAFAKYHEGVLYLVLEEPQGIIPALHLVEKFLAEGYKVDSIKLISPSSEGAAVRKGDIKDLSKWERPNSKSWIALHKRIPFHAENVLNFYKDMLVDGHHRGIEYKYPRDVYLKEAGTRKLKEMLEQSEKHNLPYSVIKDNSRPVALGMLEEDLRSENINGLLDGLSMYYLPKIKINE